MHRSNVARVPCHCWAVSPDNRSSGTSTRREPRGRREGPAAGRWRAARSPRSHRANVPRPQWSSECRDGATAADATSCDTRLHRAHRIPLGPAPPLAERYLSAASHRAAESEGEVESRLLLESLHRVESLHGEPLRHPFHDRIDGQLAARHADAVAQLDARHIRWGKAQQLGNCDDPIAARPQ